MEGGQSGMKDELQILVGKSPEILKNLRWRDLVEFAETFGVGIDEIEELKGAERVKAIAWLYWVALGRQGSFDEFLDTNLPTDLF